jgi:hypothetical protein
VATEVMPGTAGGCGRAMRAAGRADAVRRGRPAARLFAGPPPDESNSPRAVARVAAAIAATTITTRVAEVPRFVNMA